MTLLVLGINHKTATVAVREKVAFSEEKRQLALQQIHSQQLAQSAVILSTCNRTEIYLHNSEISPQECSQWQQDCQQWFADIHQLLLTELQPYLYSEQNQQAAIHLMRVACGLDSLILGEPQILGQVKQAFQMSEQFYHQLNFSFSTILSRLFQKTFSCAKRVRTETQIGENAVSVAYATCCLARQIFESLGELQVLLVGAGETIELVSRHLLRHRVKKLIICNRTVHRAKSLVEKLKADSTIEVLPLEQLQQGVNQADIVISSTASPNILIDVAMLRQAQRVRQFMPALLIDIAVPRDIDEKAGELDRIYHYTVDDLQHIIQQNLSQREQACALAEQIIYAECRLFFEWLKTRQFSDLIKSYRASAEQSRQQLLEKALLAIQQGEEAQSVLQQLSYKLTNKLLHSPTQAMQEMMKSGNAEGLHLFADSLRSHKD